jgi:hypothetical protein
MLTLTALFGLNTFAKIQKILRICYQPYPNTPRTYVNKHPAILIHSKNPNSHNFQQPLFSSKIRNVNKKPQNPTTSKLKTNEHLCLVHEIIGI